MHPHCRMSWRGPPAPATPRARGNGANCWWRTDCGWWRGLLVLLVVQDIITLGSWETPPPLLAKSPPRSRAATNLHRSRPAILTPAECAPMALRCAGVSDARAHQVVLPCGCGPRLPPTASEPCLRACPLPHATARCPPLSGHVHVHEAMVHTAAALTAAVGGACWADWMCRCQ